MSASAGRHGSRDLVHVLVAAGSIGCGAPQGRDGVAVVFAAASLTEPFTELGHALESANPDIRIDFNFAGSQQLALQIINGARADVFASADTLWMDHLRERGFVQRPEVCCHNSLVVITPRSNPAALRRFADLAQPGIKLVVGAETVPVGRYTRLALGRFSLAEEYPPDFAARVLANVVSEEENVQAVVAKVRLGEADAGIAYRSDVSAALREFVTVIDLPTFAQVVAEYPIAMVTSARNPRTAESFVHFLRSPQGQAILVRHGLVTTPPPSVGAR